MASCRGAPTIAIALLLSLSSCGGALSVAADDSGAPDASPDAPDDASQDDVVAFPDANTIVDAAAKPCPTAAPTEGEPCHTTLICEYGVDLSPTCDQLFQCYATRMCSGDTPTWHALRSRPTCPISPPAGCPSTFNEAADAASCTQGTHCDYAAGICECGMSGFNCIAAPASCPAQRPRLGTPCNVQMGPTESCPFEFEGFSVISSYGCYAFGYRCSDGAWSAVTRCGLPPPPC